VAHGQEDTVSLLDSFCNVDTGEGCGAEEVEDQSVELTLEMEEGDQKFSAVFQVANKANTLTTHKLKMPLGEKSKAAKNIEMCRKFGIPGRREKGITEREERRRREFWTRARLEGH